MTQHVIVVRERSGIGSLAAAGWVAQHREAKRRL